MSKRLKVVLIDPIARTVTDVEVAPTLAAWYRLLDCEMVETVNLAGPAVYHEWWDSIEGGRGLYLYADEEGRCKENSYFSIAPYEAEFAGKAFICEVDMDRGEERSTELTAEKVRPQVRWTGRWAARA